MGVETSFNLSGLTDLQKKLNKISTTSGKVGFFEDQGVYEESGLPISDVAYINEYGAIMTNDIVIPARPFIEPATEKIKDEVGQDIRREATDYLIGTSENFDITKPLEKLRAAISIEIIEKKEPANAPSTIKKKGKNDPLVDTGLMSESVEIRMTRGVKTL